MADMQGPSSPSVAFPCHLREGPASPPYPTPDTFYLPSARAPRLYVGMNLFISKLMETASKYLMIAQIRVKIMDAQVLLEGGFGQSQGRIRAWFSVRGLYGRGVRGSRCQVWHSGSMGDLSERFL